MYTACTFYVHIQMVCLCKHHMYMYLAIPVILLYCSYMWWSHTCTSQWQTQLATLPHPLQLHVHNLKFVLRTRLSYYNRSSPWKLLHFKHTTRKVTALKDIRSTWPFIQCTPLPVMRTIFSRVSAHGRLKLTGQKRGWVLTQTVICMYNTFTCTCIREP